MQLSLFAIIFAGLFLYVRADLDKRPESAIAVDKESRASLLKTMGKGGETIVIPGTKPVEPPKKVTSSSKIEIPPGLFGGALDDTWKAESKGSQNDVVSKPPPITPSPPTLSLQLRRTK